MDPADAAYALNALPDSGQAARKIMPATRLQSAVSLASR